MRQKFFLNDMSTLFVCPSFDFGFVERRALEDALFMRDIGGKCKILCMFGSKIYEKALKNDLEVVVYRKSINKKIDFQYFFFVRQLLKNEAFDIIHCYGLRYIWSIIVNLRNNPKVSLFLTLNKNYSSTYKKAFFLILLKRVDSVFCFSQRMKEILQENLPLNSWKLKNIGTGIDFNNANNLRSENNAKKSLGTIIPYAFNSKDDLTTLIYALKPLIENDPNLEVFLFSEEAWSDMPSKKILVEMLHLLGLDYKVALKEMGNYNNVFSHLDLFIGISQDAIDEHVIHAIARKVPVVLPRTGLSEGFWGNQRRPFETYNCDDSRELKDKCLKILGNASFYISRIEKHHASFIVDNDIQRYTDIISQEYEKSYLARHKIALRKQ